MSEPATRAQRDRAFAAFDLLWKDAVGEYDLNVSLPSERERVATNILRRARQRAREWLAAELRIGVDDCRISDFDAATCARVEQLCKHVTPADSRRWAKARGI
jgi:hypothetical protein